MSETLTEHRTLGLVKAKKLAFKQESSPVAAKQPQQKAMANVSELALAECEVYYGNFGTNFANS